MKLLLTFAAMAALAVAADNSQTVDGTWNLGMQGGDHVVPVALVLQQEGGKVSGTLMMPGNDVPLNGSFQEGQLTLTGTMEGREHGASQQVKLTAKILDDGTMAGDFGSGTRSMKWTAERLKARKK